MRVGKMVLKVSFTAGAAFGEVRFAATIPVSATEPASVGSASSRKEG